MDVYASLAFCLLTSYACAAPSCTLAAALAAAICAVCAPNTQAVRYIDYRILHTSGSRRSC